MVCWSKLCEILLLLNMADMDRLYVEGCGFSSAEYSVHLVGVNRLSVCREFCGVHSWQNGTRSTDGVKLLWCCSHLVWLVFEDSIPTYACFHSENFLVTCSCCFFLYCFLGMVRKKRGGRVGRACCVQYDSIELFFVHKELRIVINSSTSKRNCKSKRQTPLSAGFRSPSKAS